VIQIERTVRGYHCDAYGHVNNARYLEFLEDARWHFLKPAMDKDTFKDLGLLFVVVRIAIDYKRPLIPNDQIQVSVNRQEFKNMSIVFVQEIRKGDELAASAEVHFVLLDEHTHRPVAIDSNLIHIFDQLLHHA
jgi:thioesterase-3